MTCRNIPGGIQDWGKVLSGRSESQRCGEGRKGDSVAWLHHKGRNKHHFEYWIDFAPDKSAGLIGNEMPLKYLVEMVMDRIAASKVYKGDAYTDACPWEYYARGQDYAVMHKKTRAQLEKLLLMLKDEGEEKTFAYIQEAAEAQVAPSTITCSLCAQVTAVNKTGPEFKNGFRPCLCLVMQVPYFTGLIQNMFQHPVQIPGGSPLFFQ